MTAETQEKIKAAGIQVLTPEARAHVLLLRDRCMAVYDTGTGTLGSTGIFVEGALAYLVWQDERPFLVAKGNRRIAAPDEVTELRRFSEDLKQAIG